MSDKCDSEEIRVRALTIVDTNGFARARLDVDSQNRIALVLHDPQGRSRLSMSVDSTGSYLSLQAEDGTTMAALAQSQEEGTAFCLNAANEQVRFSIHIDKAGIVKEVNYNKEQGN